MLKLSQGVLIMSIGLAMFGQSVSAVDTRPRPAEPVILSTEVDLENSLMTISGRNFGKSAPTVRLADHILEVKSSSPTQLVVRLPAGIRLATYLLTVSTTGPASLSRAFNTVIFSTSAK